MEWNNILKEKFSQLSKTNYEETLQICLNAYSQGCEKEKSLAIEAYKLRCHSLIENRYMCSGRETKKEVKKRFY